MTTIPATIRERIDLPAPASAKASKTPDAGINLQDIVAILKRRLIMIMTLFFFFSILFVGLWIVGYRWFPLYGAESFIECVSNKPKPPDALSDQDSGRLEYERFILTQAEYVKSPDVLLQALRTPEIQQTKWYVDTPDSERVLAFMDLVKAAPQRNTQLLVVSCNTRSENDPHVIVNKVVELYLQRVKEFSADPYRDERESREQEREDIESQIVDKQRQLADVQRRLPPGVASGVGNSVGAEYEQQNVVVTQYELMLRELEGLYALYTSPSGPALTPEDSQLVELDPKVATLSNQLFSINQQIEVYDATLGTKNRTIRVLKKTREVVERQLEEARQRRLAEILAYKREQVSSALANVRHALSLAQEDLADKRAMLADMDAVMSEYQLLEEELYLLKQRRELLVTAIQDRDRVVREQSAVQIELRQQAIKPLQRAFPQLFLLPGAVVLAGIFSLGIVLLIEFVDTSLRTPADVVRHLSIPLLGVVPDADDEEVDIKNLELAMLEAPKSMFAESFRQIRTNLQFAAPAERERSILVTSPRPEDGKTTVATNLAISLAQSGKKVLIVDANFRRPAYHRIFEVDPSRGLSNLLIGDARFEDLVTKTKVPNLDIVVSGPLPPNPAEMLGSQQMADFIAQVSHQYDHVILGTSPVLVASDACALATRVDGVILVCRAKVNSRGIGGRACSLLTRVGGHLFGGVLNAAQVSRGGYFREQLRTYYDYNAEDDEQIMRAALPSAGKSDTGGDGPAGA